MGKKKSRNGNGKPDAEASQESLENAGSQDAPEASDSPSGEGQAKATNLSSTDSSAELDQARAEIAQLRDQLAAKDAELESLRRQLEARDAAPIFDQSKMQDMARLQERLAALRKEQAEADAARDTAWKQLKAVVQDISKLASPDYLSSINIPSQP